MPAPTTATIATMAMLRTVESRGFETRDLLSDAGLVREALEDPDARIPVTTALALWNALRERSGDPALQLAAPTTLPFGAYRVIDYLLNASATVGEAVRRFATYFGLLTDAARLTIEEEGDERRLHIALADGGAVPGVYVDYVFAAFVGRCRMTQPGVRVLRVELRHPAPRDPAPYAARFEAPVTFGAAADRLCFAVDEWDSPLEHADPGLAHVLEEHARRLSERSPDGGGGFVAAVQTALTAALPGDANAPRVARALHVSVRTLQRRLVAAGTTFRDVADRARRTLAESYLEDPGVSITEVAFLLGFSDQTSFHRAFRRWNGAAPGVWRRRAATPAAGSAPPSSAGPALPLPS
jgi:AraC-like DNA-binding protein